MFPKRYEVNGVVGVVGGELITDNRALLSRQQAKKHGDI